MGAVSEEPQGLVSQVRGRAHRVGGDLDHRILYRQHILRHLQVHDVELILDLLHVGKVLGIRPHVLEGAQDEELLRLRAQPLHDILHQLLLHGRAADQPAPVHDL